jgi:hypothetical protein
MATCSQLYGPAGLDVGQLTPVPTSEEAGWSPGMVWMLYKNTEITNKYGVGSVGDAVDGTELG